jgi:hypothetical protein
LKYFDKMSVALLGSLKKTLTKSTGATMSFARAFAAVASPVGTEVGNGKVDGYVLHPRYA